jgi:hypothetical protein
MVGCILLEIERPEIIIFITGVVFLLAGIITTEDAFQGFSNQGMLTVALFFIKKSLLKIWILSFF